MTDVRSTAFALPPHLAAKADPTLVGDDDQHFAAMTESLEHTVADLTERLDAARRDTGGRGEADAGQLALDRDLEVHRLSSRLRTLRRFSLDLCLGRMVPADGSAPVYVGRLGLADRTGARLLVDWRSPAAEPFFGATHANPMGLASRRRYRWTRGRVTDYWDEVFTEDGLAGNVALDEESAFIASLGEGRTGRMRDVLATIQADQDAVIRAGSRGTLVVDGGPGTGKTVVALHRAAYLLYADPRLREGRGGILFVGPSRPYLSYVADVLPSLGEEGVRTCTLHDLLPEGATAVPERDPEVARLKADARIVSLVEPAVALYEEPPADGVEVETPWGDLWVGPDDWAEAFGAVEPGTPHNDARDQVWEDLVGILHDKLGVAVDDDGVEEALSREDVRRVLAADEALTDAFGGAWPTLDPADLVGDLWSVPAYLRRCAPWLSPDELRVLQRPDAPHAWTDADLPLLDAARLRIGDPAAARRRRRHAAELASRREEMSQVVEHLISTDDSMMQVMSMLKGDDLRGALVDDSGLDVPDPDVLAGPFAHVVVDEAQELTDAQWQMLLLRCPSRSFTVVGDRAQARHGFAEPWTARLARVGLDRVGIASLTINYRTPAEVMSEAEPVIRTVLPDANVPTSVRSTGVPVHHGSLDELDAVVTAWAEEHPDGIGCVIGLDADRDAGAASYAGSDRVRFLTPELAKGLEFDLVVLIDPASFGTGVEGAVDRYVAMTRATQRLVVLTPA